MRLPGATAEWVIGRIAARSHGVVTRRELLEAGVTEAEIRHRVGTGALLREHPGVFRVGHRAPSIEATYMAAVRACGDGAALSGRAAAHLWGLVTGPPPRPEVTAPGRRRVKGARTRRAKKIFATKHRGIPITTIPVTVVSLAAVLPAEHLGRVVHEAGIRYRTTPDEVLAALNVHANSPGARTLRRLVTGDEPITLSRLERRFFELLRRAGLPLPATNQMADGRRVDCRWPDVPLTVELDGYRYHRSRHAWERDRRREREARARGDEFRRYTWGDVYDDPEATLAELSPLLTGLG